MNYYIIVYVDQEGGRHLKHIVENEEVARQFCKDENELMPSYSNSHYIYMSRKEWLSLLAKTLKRTN